MSVTETELAHVNHEHIDTFDSDDDKIVINVGGQRHVTLTSTLLKKPGTRLWHLVMRNNGSGNRNREFFFDRHPGVFSSVIDYYRTDELHVPLDVCGAAVKRELDFWQIEDTLIKACCWISYSSHIGNERTLRKFDQDTQLQKDLLELDNLKGWRKKQMQLWLVLDHPRSSTLAMVFAVTSFLFVLASITGFCLETHPSMYEKLSVNRTCGSAAIKPTVIYQHKPFLHVLDYVCTIFFTAELLLRVTVTPSKRRFFRSPMNLIDILALLPLYVQIGLKVMDHENCLKGSRYVIETIFILRIIRVFRIFHLVRQYKALQILIHAMRASVQELLMLSIFLLIAMLVFSTLIFYAERRGSFTSLDDLNSTSTNNFESIPVGFWWSIITMTTVGYGDTFPKTPMGFMVGSLCAVSGVLLLALTIPVMSSNFTLFYMHARSREDIGTGGDTATGNGVMPSSAEAAAVLKEVGCSDPSDHGGSRDVISDDQHHQPDYHTCAPVDGDDPSNSRQAHTPIPTESSIP